MCLDESLRSLRSITPYSRYNLEMPTHYLHHMCDLTLRYPARFLDNIYILSNLEICFSVVFIQLNALVQLGFDGLSEMRND
jgi:hypothetical protein